MIVTAVPLVMNSMSSMYRSIRYKSSNRVLNLQGMRGQKGMDCVIGSGLFAEGRVKRYVGRCCDGFSH